MRISAKYPKTFGPAIFATITALSAPTSALPTLATMVITNLDLVVLRTDDIIFIPMK